MSNRFRVSREWKVELPDRDTGEYNGLLEVYKNHHSASDYAEMAELYVEMAPEGREDLIENGLVYWVTELFHGSELLYNELATAFGVCAEEVNENCWGV